MRRNTYLTLLAPEEARKLWFERLQAASRVLPEENVPLTEALHRLLFAADTWGRPYSREQAAYPVPGLREFKFWPAAGRVDNVFGDRQRRGRRG